MNRTHMTWGSSTLVSSLLMVGVCLLHPEIASAGSPTEALQTTSEKARMLLNEKQLNGSEHMTDRRSQLMTIIRERFSCEEMSKRALGAEWLKRSEAEQQEFTQLFQALLAKSYAGKIEGYGAEPIRYLDEQITNGYAVVRAHVSAVKNVYVLDFRLVSKTGNWL